MKPKSTPIDRHIARRLKEQRKLLGLTQKEVAQRANISFQQVQKYEYGTSCISAGRLYELATILCIPVSFLFEDLERSSRQAA